MENKSPVSFDRFPSGDAELAPKDILHEGLVPRIEKTSEAHGVAVPGRRFEELVHQALEEELKFERDPLSRDLASQRADEILARFADANGTPQPENQSAVNGLSASAGAADRLGQKPRIDKSGSITAPQNLPQPAKRPTLSPADVVMAFVILILLFTIIFLLIL